MTPGERKAEPQISRLLAEFADGWLVGFCTQMDQGVPSCPRTYLLVVPAHGSWLLARYWDCQGSENCEAERPWATELQVESRTVRWPRQALKKFDSTGTLERISQAEPELATDLRELVHPVAKQRPWARASAQKTAGKREANPYLPALEWDLVTELLREVVGLTGQQKELWAEIVESRIQKVGPALTAEVGGLPPAAEKLVKRFGKWTRFPELPVLP